jgi:molecular chaperone GrpE
MADNKKPGPPADDIEIPTSGENQNEEVDTDLNQLFDQIKKASDERDEIKGQLLRTMADFQNYKKPVLDEKRQIEERANERLVSDLLPVIDNFERALAVAETGGTFESLFEGVKAIERQFRSVLDSQKLQRIEAVGTPFDPDLHDALGMVESSEHEPGTVIEEVESGYRLGAKVIRPARVRVSKKP